MNRLSRAFLLAALVGVAPSSAGAADFKAGDTAVVVRTTEFHPLRGAAVTVPPGTCLAVREVDDRGPVLSMGKVGRIDGAALLAPDAATAAFAARIAADPRDAVALAARGAVAFYRGKLDAAIADLDASLKLAPNADALTTRGWAWKRKGDKDKAMADFDEAIRLDPKAALAWRVRGATYAGKADYRKALEGYDESIRLDPENPDSLHHRVNLLGACKDDAIRDGKRAVADATAACELTQWKSPHYVIGLAVACAETGDFEAAVKWHEKAVGLSPALATEAHASRLADYRARKPYRTIWR